jgi:sulfoxide reductase catalytic subunit YedY
MKKEATHWPAALRRVAAPRRETDPGRDERAKNNMANVIIRPDWRLPERLVTPERVGWDRRRFLHQSGLAGAALLAAPLAGHSTAGEPPAPSTSPGFPAKRNPAFNPNWKLTDAAVAASYNNFYEYTLDKSRVQRLAQRLPTSPWPLQIGGLVDKPLTIDAWDLMAEMPQEERVYRFRCVEAWAMIVPWTGFPFSKLIEKVSPKSEAKFVRMETFNRRDWAPGMAELPRYPWPYFEGLRMDEALHPLTMVVTGIYGKPLPKQHGAPIRLVVPWKYGYKSIKSIVKIEFIATQPKTFWETLAPDEYPFESNVNPAVPHPRWSQATERMIDTNDRVRTLPYNGYADQVAKLYPKG